MPTLHMLIGLPYSGKSTLAEKLADNLGNSCQLISFDDYFTALDAPYNEAFMSTEIITNGLACIQKDVSNTLSSGGDIVLDQPNISWYSRRYIIGAAHTAGYDVVGYVLPKQHIAREEGHYVPDDVITSMELIYEPPTLEEGFAQLIHMGVSDVVTFNRKESPKDE